MAINPTARIFILSPFSKCLLELFLIMILLCFQLWYHFFHNYYLDLMRFFLKNSIESRFSSALINVFFLAMTSKDANYFTYFKPVIILSVFHSVAAQIDIRFPFAQRFKRYGQTLHKSFCSIIFRRILKITSSIILD